MPTILLVHGAFSHPGHMDGWARYFADAGYPCLVPALPGHDPRDASALERCTLTTYLGQLGARAATLSEPPIVIGHGMGGLLVQQLASLVPCAALVCVASAPPGMLLPQLGALPRLLPLMPAILAGRPFRPSDAALRHLALHDLPEEEQARLAPSFIAESGKAYREMVLGTARLPGRQFEGPALCVSGGEDRIVSARTARAIARRYRADEFVYPERGHWLVAHQDVAERILDWVEARV